MGEKNDEAALAEIFEKLIKIFNDEQTQNGLQHPGWLKEVERRKEQQQPRREGMLGTEGNPVPVNGALGEITYLSQQRRGMFKQRRLYFHRLGSKSDLDVFETVTDDGKEWAVVWMDLYHETRCSRPLKGYKMKVSAGWTGVNTHVEDFPRGLLDAQEELRRTLHVPTVRVAGMLKVLSEPREWARPARHKRLLDEVTKGLDMRLM